LTPALVLAAVVAGAPISAPDLACDGPGTRAYFMIPTERYPHGALGDDREWGGLVYDGAVYAGHVLGPDAVFEDVAPRLADFDGDCGPEIVVVESDAERGAQLAIYGVERGMLRKIAATPHIGQRFRWLAPAGVADFDGDGALDVAFVRTPHIDGTLEFWTFAPQRSDGGLTRIASAEGVSNHRFGAETIDGGLRDCGAGPEVVLADFGWTETLVAALDGAAVRLRGLGVAPTAESFASALDCAPETVE
jgi:hypothetical protein